MKAIPILVALPALCTCLSPSLAADAAVVSVKDGVWEYRHPALTVRLTPRTPDQMAAFYEARGFPASMVDLTRTACFITVGIRNKSDRVIWLDLDQWRFTGPEGAIVRIDRQWWKDRWRDMDAPLPGQSTFRWTLLPEALDFRPGEREGGNITLPRAQAPLRLQARFDTGADRDGETVEMIVENLRCAEDSPP
jgi:hypothetical protein